MVLCICGKNYYTLSTERLSRLPFSTFALQPGIRLWVNITPNITPYKDSYHSRGSCGRCPYSEAIVKRYDETGPNLLTNFELHSQISKKYSRQENWQSV